MTCIKRSPHADADEGSDAQRLEYPQSGDRAADIGADNQLSRFGSGEKPAIFRPDLVLERQSEEEQADCGLHAVSRLLERVSRKILRKWGNPIACRRMFLESGPIRNSTRNPWRLQ